MTDDLEPNLATAVPALPDITLDLTKDEKIRATALALATKYHADTIISDGQMYQSMMAQGKEMRITRPQLVVEAAIVFEGYLRGQYNEMVMQLILGVNDAIFDAFREDQPDSADPKTTGESEP